MELYYVIAITDRDRGESMSALYRGAGLHMILAMLGRGTATSEHLSVYGLDATEKVVISGVASGEEAAQLLKAAKRKLFIDIPGNGVMLTVPLKSVAGGRTLAYLTDSQKTGGKPNMEFKHELIVVILNEGYSDFVMDAARAAGAGGGTVLHAKGTGSRRAEKFFGVSLAEEKDLIYIVAHSDEKAAIMSAISEKAGPGTKAGAICFSLPISSVAGLRARDEG
ncbi:MAG: P-II family nitrogen regulator [Aristaeellaceae bacterium]